MRKIHYQLNRDSIGPYDPDMVGYTYIRSLTMNKLEDRIEQVLTQAYPDAEVVVYLIPGALQELAVEGIDQEEVEELLYREVWTKPLTWRVLLLEGPILNEEGPS